MVREQRTLIVGSLGGTAVAYDLDLRHEPWRYSSPGSGSVSFGIAADEKLAYIPFLSGRMTVLDITTGVERWRLEGRSGGSPWPPAFDAGRVFIVSGPGVAAYDLG
jgi:outer membrane protein assembly factor BamB